MACADRNEQERLRRLHETHLLDSATENQYDELLALATRLCGAKKGAITFVDEQMIFYKSSIGFETLPTPRAESVCDHTIRQGALLVVEDLWQDERFSSKELLTRSGTRFYAGVPLSTRDGYNLGAICVMSDSPRNLSGGEKQNLEVIARQISSIIELRVEKRRSEHLLKNLEFQRTLFETYFSSMPVESCLKDASGRILVYNTALAKRFGISSKEWIGKTSAELWPPDLAAQIGQEDAEIWRTGEASTRYLTVPYQAEVIHWRYTRVPCRASDGQEVMLCILVDITTEVQQRLDSERERVGLLSTASRLRKRLQRDDLTGLQNRAAFEAGCLSALFELKATGKQFGVLSVDVGALSLLNRTYGMEEVDDLLRRVADALLQDASSNETAARVAGGSFRIILSPATDDTLMTLAKRIEGQIDGLSWKRKTLSPILRLQLFTDRQMHPGDLYSTPKRLVGNKAGAVRVAKRNYSSGGSPRMEVFASGRLKQQLPL